MHVSNPSNRFLALDKALEAAAVALEIADSIPAPFRSMTDQVVRAASSVPANLGEGAGRTGKDRLYHWRVAYSSAREVDVFLRLLLGAGAVDRLRTLTALALFDEVRAMTWRLTHQRGQRQNQRQ